MLTIKNVSFSYRRKAVLKNISLNLNGGVYGLLGPNGSGKTTLLRCIAGIVTPRDGTIEKPEKIGYLPQSFGMFPELTVYEALSYFATMKGIPNASLNACIIECLELVNLDEKRNEKIGNLSGGMIRRLGIAQAIIGDPELIIVDEPTTGLDPEERMRFKNLIARIKHNQTIIIATHIVDDVEALCDHVILLNNGMVICQEKTEDLRKEAEGFVYNIPWEEKGNITVPYTIMCNEASNEARYLRILSPNLQPGKHVASTLEDGYMLKIKGYYVSENN